MEVKDVRSAVGKLDLISSSKLYHKVFKGVLNPNFRSFGFKLNKK